MGNGQEVSKKFFVYYTETYYIVIARRWKLTSVQVQFPPLPPPVSPPLALIESFTTSRLGSVYCCNDDPSKPRNADKC